VRRRKLLAALGTAAITGPPIAAVAQRPTGVPRIGVLMGSSPSVEAVRFVAFRRALEKLGYIDGQTILIEPRYAMGQPDRLGSLAHELAALAPAVIACVGRQEATALQTATRTIPIVFMQVNDPVEQGFVATLARPGGNTTGFTQMSAELDPKRLELLHDIAPSLSRVAFFVNPTLTPGLQERFAGAEAAAKSLGIALRRVTAATPAELTGAFAEIEESSSEALLVQSDPMLGGPNSHGFWILRSLTGCRQSWRVFELSRSASCSATDPTSSKTRGSRPAMSPRSWKAPSPPTCRSSSRQDSCSKST
jgi:putative tryptophan/tyrosine transport system substrate-binding protein